MFVSSHSSPFFRNLKDCDVFSKSDPLCVIFEAFHSASAGLQYGEIGRTECVKNCLNPEWNTKIILDYMFEERQRMKFEMYVLVAHLAIIFTVLFKL